MHGESADRRAADKFLEKAKDAERMAQSATDPNAKLSWLSIATSYRELAEVRLRGAHRS